MKAGIINTGISLVDKDYYSEHNSVSIASIRLAPDGFSFALFDTLRNKYVKLESFDLQGIKNEHSWIETIGILISEKMITPAQYLTTHLQSEFPGALLVPSKLFSPNKKDLHFKYNYYPSQKQQILEDHIPEIDAVMLHPLSDIAMNFIHAAFPEAIIKHQASSLISILKKQYLIGGIDKNVFVQVRKNEFDIVAFKNGKLLFFNTFQFRTVEDFLYFLLNTLQQLNIDTEKQEVFFLGNLTSGAALASKASKYIRFVKFLKNNPNDDFSPVFNEIESHQYLNLLNLKNCE